MEVSQLILNPIAKFICGDSSVTPYMSGPTLVMFFNNHGFNDVYESGFPSRWKYTEDKVIAMNGTERLQRVLEDVIDPRRFVNNPLNVENAIEHLNDLLKYDDYKFIHIGGRYKLSEIAVAVIATSAIEINHNFITEQITKCNYKIQEADYNGAVTNARSLIEAVFIEIIERIEMMEVKNDGNLDNLWSRTKKAMKLELDKASMPDSVFQILSGIDTAVKGLAGLSNLAGDRHATKFKTRKHHAKLAVNLSLAISDFLFDSLEYQISTNR